MFGHNLHLLVAPNPATDFVNIELEDAHYSIKLFDVTGKCVIEQKSVLGIRNIDLTALNPGIYFIQILGEKKLFSGKLLKQ